MSKFVLTPSARLDMVDIWEYTSQTWDDEQAETYVRQLNYGFERLAEMPSIGQDYKHARKGYRKYQILRHLIFYHVISDDLIEIVRVLHERMDVDRYL